MEIDNKYKISFKWKLSFCFAMLLTLFLLLGNFNESQAANSDVGYLSDKIGRASCRERVCLYV